MKVQTNFSTLGLQAQEFLSAMVDLGDKRLSLKQKESCKNYDLHIGEKGDETNHEANKLPNVADIFDLWPYIMYYNETKNAHSKDG